MSEERRKKFKKIPWGVWVILGQIILAKFFSFIFSSIIGFITEFIGSITSFYGLFSFDSLQLFCISMLPSSADGYVGIVIGIILGNILVIFFIGKLLKRKGSLFWTAIGVILATLLFSPLFINTHIINPVIKPQYTCYIFSLSLLTNIGIVGGLCGYYLSEYIVYKKSD